MTWDLGSIPEELTKLPQWVLWSFEVRDGDRVKVPMQSNGRYASTDKRGTWSSFAAASHLLRSYPDKFDGIGFVFTEEDDFIGIDIDNCVNAEGKVSEAARYIIDEMDSYTEYSPSGKGFHIIARGKLPEWFTGTGKKNVEQGLEIYRYRRFFTITGHRENDNGVEERTDELETICDNFFSHSEEAKVLIEIDIDDEHPERFSDKRLLEMMFKSEKQGQDIKLLHEGRDTHDDDTSSSDMAYCNYLAFWTDKNPIQMDRIYRSSGRMRDKWDRRTGNSTYGWMTITKAISDTNKTLMESDKEKPFSVKIVEAKNVASELDDDDLPQFDKAARFPTNIFPYEIKEYVERASESVNAPEDFTAIGTLAVISSMIGNQAKIQVTSEWTENCIMYAAFIGSPGVRKTPALTKAMMPLNRIQKQLDQEHEQELLNHDHEMAKHEIVFGKWLQESKKKGENADFDDRPVEPEPPIRRQIKVNDITVETVVEMMEENSLLMERDEFVGWIKSMNQYKGGSGGERQTYLEFWNGNRVDVNRKGGKHTSVENPFITIVGGIQPARLSEVLSDNIDDGFVERILFSYPDEFPVIRLNDIQIPDSIKSAYVDACDTLYYRTKSTGKDVEIMRLDPTAFKVFRDYYNSLNDEIREPEFNSILEGAWIKLTAYLARFTLILHCIHWACRSPYATRKNDISPEIVKLSIQLIEYYKKHTEKVYKFLAADVEDQRLKRAAEWIVDKMPDKKCTARDIQKANVCGVKKKSEAEKLIADLVESGYGIAEEEKAKNGRTVYTFTLKI